MSRFDKPVIPGFNRDIEENIGDTRHRGNRNKAKLPINNEQTYDVDPVGELIDDYERRLESVKELNNFIGNAAFNNVPVGQYDEPIQSFIGSLTGGQDLNQDNLECIRDVAGWEASDTGPAAVNNYTERMSDVVEQARRVQPIKFGLEFFWLLLRLVFGVIVHGTIGFLCWWIPTNLVIPFFLVDKIPKALGNLFGKLERLLLENKLINFKCVYKSVQDQENMNASNALMDDNRQRVATLREELEELQVDPISVQGGNTSLTESELQQRQNRIDQINLEIASINNEIRKTCADASGNIQVVFPCCSSSPFEIVEDDPCFNEFIQEEAKRQVCPNSRIPVCGPGWRDTPLYDENDNPILNNAPCYIDVINAQQVVNSLSRSANNMLPNPEDQELDLSGLIQQYVALDKTIKSTGKTLKELKGVYKGKVRGVDGEVGCNEFDYTADIVNFIRFKIIEKYDLGSIIHLYNQTKQNTDLSNNQSSTVFLNILNNISDVYLANKYDELLSSDSPAELINELDKDARQLGRLDIFELATGETDINVPTTTRDVVTKLIGEVKEITELFNDRYGDVKKSVKQMRRLFNNATIDFFIDNKSYDM